LSRRIFGFGIRHIQHIVLVDEDAARPPELLPGGEEFPILIENRDAAVAAVRHEQTPLRIEGQHMQTLQLAVARTQMAEAFDELAVPVEFHDARIAECRCMAFGDENVAIRRKGDSRRSVKDIESRAALAGLTQS